MNIDVPSIFESINLERQYGYLGNAKRQYSCGDKERRADKCIECGACEGVCPQKIKIRELLQYANENLA
jgi:predicted aldo/keto reductase-like oxidoreductase